MFSVKNVTTLEIPALLGYCAHLGGSESAFNSSTVAFREASDAISSYPVGMEGYDELEAKGSKESKIAVYRFTGKA